MTKRKGLNDKDKAKITRTKGTKPKNIDKRIRNKGPGLKFNDNHSQV